MADLGDLNLQISGDISPLEQAFAEIPAVAQQAAAGIDQALASVGGESSTATAGIQQLSDALSGMWQGDWAGEAAQFGAAVSGAGDAAGGAVPPVHDLGDAAHHASEGAKEAGGGFDELKGHIIDLLKEFGLMIGVVEAVKESLKAFAEEQTFVVAMTAMTGSAATATTMLEELKTTALEIPVALDLLLAAAQKMEAFGIATERIPELLHAAADAAAATGNSFDLVAASIERISVTGQVNARQLVQLGLSWQDLANTAGVSMAEVQELVKKGGQSIEQDLDLVVKAVQQKFGGLSATMADTLAGGWQIFKNQLSELAAQIGEALAPIAEALLQIVGGAVQTLSDFFRTLLDIFKDLTPAGAALEQMLGALAIAMGGLMIAFDLTGWGALLMVIGSMVAALSSLAGATETAAEREERLAAARKIATDDIKTEQTAADALSAALARHGIVMKQTGDDTDTWSKKLQAVADDLFATEKVLDEAAVHYASFGGLMKGMFPTLESFQKYLQAHLDALHKTADDGAMTQVISQHTKLQNAVDATGAALSRMEEYQRQGLASQGQVDDALKDYNKALDDLDGKLEKTTKSHDSFASSVKSVGKTIQDSFNAASDSYDAYLEKLNDGGKSAADQLTKINDEIQKATALLNTVPASKKTIITQWIDDLTALKTDMQDFAQRDVVREQLTALSDSLVDLESKAATASMKIPADFADMMAGVNQGINFGGITTSFDKMIADIKAKFALLPAELKAADEGATQALVENLQSASDKLHSMDDAMKLIGSNKGLTQLATEVKGLADQEAAGALSASQWQLGLNKVSDELLKSLVPALEKGVEITPELITQLARLGDTGKILADAAKIGPEAFILAVQNMAEKTREAALTIGNAFKDLGATSLASVAQSMTRYGADITKALSEVTVASKLTASEFAVDQNAIIVWADKVLPLMKNFGVSISSDVLAQVAKLAPALAAAAKEGPDAFATALQKMKDTASTAIMGISDAYKEFGVQSLPVLDSILQRQQKGYDLLVSSGAPLAAQLEALTKINATQMSIAQYTDLTGQSELKIAETMTQVKLAQFALHQETMGLADTWNGMANALGTAWNSVSKSLADAIVNGKSFGDVMMNVLKTLETNILDVLIKQAMNQLAASVITNSGLMHALGLTAGTTQATVAASMAASAASMAASSAAMAASMAGSAVAIGGSTAAVDASMGTMAISGTAALTAMAAAMAANSAAIDASALAMVPIVGGAIATVEASYVSMVPVIGSSLAALSGATIAASATASGALGSFAGAATVSMATASTAVVAAGSVMMATFTAIAGIIGAIAGIFSAIELAHTNTLLTRIEESTRRLDITTEGAIVASLVHLNALEDIKTLLFSIEASDFNSEALLEGIAADVHGIFAAIQAGGGFGGGTGGGGMSAAVSGSLASISSMIDTLSRRIDDLQTQVGGGNPGVSYVINGGGGGGNPVYTTPTINLPGGSTGVYTGYSGSSAVQSGTAAGGGVTVQVTVQAGVVAGSNGMSQLANMVGAQVVQSLRLSGGAKL